MTYINKGFFLIVGTALMVILLLAAGGVHLLPEYVFKSLMAALFSVLAYIISPVVIYVAWAIVALVFLILSAVAISAVPEGGNGGIDWTWYNMRRNQGMSHSEAFNDARIHASQKR